MFLTASNCLKTILTKNLFVLLWTANISRYKFLSLQRSRHWEKCIAFTSQPTFTCSKLTIKTLEQRCETCSKLAIKTPKRRQWRRFGVFVVNFEHISHLYSSVSIVLYFLPPDTHILLPKMLILVKSSTPYSFWPDIGKMVKTDIQKIWTNKKWYNKIRKKAYSR